MARTRTKEFPHTMKLMLDLDGSGFSALFKPYQIEIVRLLFEEDPVTSRQVYEHLKDQGITISRASVIFYLNTLEKAGILEISEESGKGGFHKIYTITMTHIEFEKFWIMKALNSLFECFPTNAFLAKVKAEGL